MAYGASGEGAVHDVSSSELREKSSWKQRSLIMRNYSNVESFGL